MTRFLYCWRLLVSNYALRILENGNYHLQIDKLTSRTWLHDVKNTVYIHVLGSSPNVRHTPFKKHFRNKNTKVKAFFVSPRKKRVLNLVNCAPSHKRKSVWFTLYVQFPQFSWLLSFYVFQGLWCRTTTTFDQTNLFSKLQLLACVCWQS